MTKKFRFMVRLLAVVLAVVMLSSAVYIAVEADHDCFGDDCAICRQISICENLLKSLGLAGAAAVFAAAVRYALCRVIPSCAAPRRDERHTDACCSQGKAFELKTGFLQGRSLSIFG